MSLALLFLYLMLNMFWMYWLVVGCWLLVSLYSTTCNYVNVFGMEISMLYASVYVCMHLCVHVHSHVCARMCIHIKMFVCASTCMCMHVHTCVHVRTRMCVCVCVAQVSSFCAFHRHVLSTTQLYFTKWLSYIGKKFCCQYCMCMCQLPLHHANDLQSAACHEHDLEFYPRTCNCFNMSPHTLGDAILVDRKGGHLWFILVLFMFICTLISGRTLWPWVKILVSLFRQFAILPLQIFLFTEGVTSGMSRIWTLIKLYVPPADHHVHGHPVTGWLQYPPCRCC